MFSEAYHVYQKVGHGVAFLSEFAFVLHDVYSIWIDTESKNTCSGFSSGRGFHFVCLPDNLIVLHSQCGLGCFHVVWVTV